MGEHLLEINNISKSFEGVQALKNVSLIIGKGEIHCLAGENGSGKSTLIKVIAGAVKPDEGNVEINGKSFKRLTPIDSIKEGIQIIYQDFSVFPNLTVAENIALNSAIQKEQKMVNWKQIYKTAEEALKMINVDVDLKAYVEDLPVADKQLIAISRALLQNAKLIIMDEPTTALTNKEVRSLFKVIKLLQQKGVSVLFVSHKLDEVFEVCEKITIIRNGKNVISKETVFFDKSKFIYYMTGKEIEDSFYECSSKNGNSILKVENLTRKGYFNDISFELYSGDILGITGLLGSGRTELALSLFGLCPADSGDIYINGELRKICNVQDAMGNRIAYVPEDRLTEGLFLEQAVKNNIVASIFDKLKNNLGFIDKDKINQMSDFWINKLGVVTSSGDLDVKALSGGNQQKVVLAKWLCTEPQIFILNGPTVGVDIGSKADIHQIIREYVRKNVGVILISDDIHELKHNCNRILVMKKGRLCGEFCAGEIAEEDLLF